jgi:hypothetical protein
MQTNKYFEYNNIRITGTNFFLCESTDTDEVISFEKVLYLLKVKQSFVRTRLRVCDCGI